MEKDSNRVANWLKWCSGHLVAVLPEIGEQRLKSMDEAGVTVQVLSNSGPGPELLSGQAGIDMARGLNDHLAAAVARHPDRFGGFAALPLQDPDAAAKSRVRVFDMAASENLPVAGMHLHSPGFARMTKRAGAFVLVPET